MLTKTMQDFVKNFPQRMIMQPRHFFIFTLSLSTWVHATLLVQEDFSGYTSDATVVGTGPAKTGFTGNWAQTGGLSPDVNFYQRSTGLSYSNFTTGGGSLEYFRNSGSGGTKILDRAIDFSPVSVSGSDVLYLGFLFKYSGSFTTLDFIYENDAENRINSFGIGGGNLTIDLAGSNGSSLNLGSVASDTTHMVLLRISDNTTGGGGNDAFYDNVEAWLNPDLLNLGTADQTGVGIISKFAGGNTDIAGDNLRISGPITSGSSVTFDEFFITDDLSDVTVIPEPSSVALVLLGGLTTLAVVRRRQRG